MVKWKDEFSVGYEKFDEQHKELIDILNSLEDIIKDKDLHSDLFYDHVNDILNEILDYTEYHFRSEEEVFEEKGYEFTEEHKDSHETFVINVKDEVSKFQSGKDEKKVAKNIYDTLVKWLFKHIMGEDKKYMNKLD